MGLTNTFIGWRSLLAQSETNEAIKQKYLQLFVLYAIWLNLPWLVMGAGILSGGAHGVLDYLVPSSGNLTVVFWWGLFLAMNFTIAIWVFFAGGAEKLEKFPGLPTLLSGTAAKIKIFTSVCFILVNLVAGVLYFHNPWAQDGRVYSTKVLMDFPFFFCLFFVLFWLLGSWMIARHSGWTTLALAYGTNRKYVGPQLKGRTAKLNWVHYHTCLNIGANGRGLSLTMGYFFNLNHKNLFIPWNDIQLTKSEMTWGPTVVLHFEKVPKVLMELPEKNVLRLKEMADNPDAFKGFSK
jgi:hypothetical protein